MPKQKLSPRRAPAQPDTPLPPRDAANEKRNHHERFVFTDFAMI